MRPETYLLLDGIEPGLLWHPNPLYPPLETTMFADCEVVAVDLIRDIVLAAPGAAAPPTVTSSYWLDLASGTLQLWTGAEPAQWREQDTEDRH